MCEFKVGDLVEVVPGARVWPPRSGIFIVHDVMRDPRAYQPDGLRGWLIQLHLSDGRFSWFAAVGFRLLQEG